MSYKQRNTITRRTTILKTSGIPLSSGQTLIAIVLLMLLALGIGITISTRFFKTLHTVTTGDSAYKAARVAEAVSERLLSQSMETLADYISSGTCGSSCSLQVTDSTGKVITANATLSYYGNTSSEMTLDLTQTNSAEIDLDGYTSNGTLDVCWNGDYSIYFNYVYLQNGRYYADSYAYNSVGSSHGDNDFSAATGAHGYQSCFTVNTRYSPVLGRLKTYYADGPVTLYPVGGAVLPTQGILIESIGQVDDIREQVRVLKTTPVLPIYADYVLFQRSETEPFSNYVVPTN